MIANGRGNHTTNQGVVNLNASNFILAYNGIQMHLQYTFGSISPQNFTPTPLRKLLSLAG
jgi:hypothetical protein